MKLACTLLCTTMGVFAFASEAMAQGARPTDVQEIVVTAQRRSEILEKVPMAVTVLSPDVIKKGGVDGFMDLGKVATGVKLDFSGSVPTVAIRGISTLVTGFSAETNVAVYVDGIYDPQVLTMNSDLANLESIQVLKGPQGALYGRNATGGAILINTRGPTKSYTGAFEASYGRFNDKMLNAYVAGPLNDKVRFSLSGHYRANDGYIKLISPTDANQTVSDKALPFKQGQVRAKLEADLTENLTALVGFVYGYSGDDRANVYGQFGQHAPASITSGVFPIHFDTTAYDHHPHNWGQLTQESLKLTYNTPIGALTSYTAYGVRELNVEFDFDQTYRPLVTQRLKYKQHTFQQSVDFNVTSIKNVDLVIGGLYYADHFQTRPGWGIMTYANNILLSRQFQVQPTDSWALYADGTYHVTDRLSIGAGGRFSSDWKRAEFTVFTGTGAVAQPTVSDSAKWTKFTPRVTARYELADRTDVYASWSKGFHSGTFNGSAPVGVGTRSVPAAPETVTAYEVGFKTAQSMFRFQSSVFYYDYRNFQVSLLIPNPFCGGGAPGSCGTVAITSNAPKAKIYGWDNEITITPVEHLTVRAGVEWLHARYGSFANANGIGVNAANTANISPQTQDWTHLRMVRAPDWSGNAAVDYEIPTSYGNLLLTGAVTFSSRYPIQNASVYGPAAPANLQHVQRFTQNPMALLSAQATWTDPTDHYSVTIYGDNLTNHVYRLSYNASTFGDFTSKAEPVTYGVKVGYKF